VTSGTSSPSLTARKIAIAARGVSPERLSQRRPFGTGPSSSERDVMLPVPSGRRVDLTCP
jgi:hypothetical protein